MCYYNIASDTWVVISSNLVDQFNNSLAATFSALGNGDIAIDGLGNLWIVAASSTQWGLYEISAPLPTSAIPSVTLTEKIPPTQPTPSGDPFVGIAYNATGQIYLSTVDDLYLLENDLSITHISTFSTTGVVVDLTSCNYPINILPISWISFTAHLQSNNSVLLNWSVSQQLNETGYYIEHSRNGQSWENIGYRKSRQGEGEKTYEFIDVNPNSSINYYRIRTSSLDGRSSYSEIKKVSIATNSVNIWPIPAKNNINIQTVSSGSIQILSSSGQEMGTYLLHGGTNSIDINSLHTGYYVAHIVLSNGEVINQRFVK